MGFGYRGGGSHWGRVTLPKPPPPERAVSAVALVGGSLDASRALLSEADVAAVADLFVRRRWKLVWCGMGSGLAGLVAQAVLARGGAAEAIVVRGQEPADVPMGALRYEVTDFHERGKALFDRGDGALVLPGGVGTLAELSELLAWRVAGLYNHPVVVFDPNRWFGAFKRLVAKMETEGVAPSGSRAAVVFAKSPEAVKKEMIRVRVAR
jgi:uncharacterized protein (TIGR00730 family)